MPDDRVVPTVSVQPDRIDLGETATLTLAVEGRAPLRVELPNEIERILSAKSVLMWQIQPISAARITPHEGGRERWEQSFKLSPFFHGERVLLAFNAIPVNGQPVTFEAQSVRVHKTIEDVSAEKAIPITGIETLPSVPPPAPDASGWVYLAVLIGVFSVVLTAVLIRKARRTVLPVPPSEWAARELDGLERDAALERVEVRIAIDRLAALLREFVERRFGLAATRQTTSELSQGCHSAEWPPERTTVLIHLLESCDRARFADQIPDRAVVLDWIGSARTWLSGIEPPA